MPIALKRPASGADCGGGGVQQYGATKGGVFGCLNDVQGWGWGCELRGAGDEGCGGGGGGRVKSFYESYTWNLVS